MAVTMQFSLDKSKHAIKEIHQYSAYNASAIKSGI